MLGLEVEARAHAELNSNASEHAHDTMTIITSPRPVRTCTVPFLGRDAGPDRAHPSLMVPWHDCRAVWALADGVYLLAVDEPGAPPPQVHTTAAGTAIAAYWLLDGYVIGIPTVVLAAWLNPLIVFAVAAVIMITINLWACGWIDRSWDTWAGGKVEAKLEKVRSKGVGKKVAAWVARGSDGWFVLAAAVTNAITTVAMARLAGGKPLGRHRIVLAALAYGLFAAALWSLLGWLAGDAIRAL